MTAWSTLSESLTPERLKLLLREDLPSGYQFVGLEPALEDIARDAQSARYLSENNLWEAAGENPSVADQRATDLSGLLEQIEAFQLSPDASVNPNTERESIITGITEHRTWLIRNARPYRAPEDSEALAELERVRGLRKELAEAVDESKTALGTIRSRAAETGAVTAAGLYKDRATLEDKSAKRSMIGLAICGGSLTIATIALFTWNAPSHTSSPGEAIWGVAGRALALAALAYGMTFFARNYRASRHLATVNRFKANALEATPLLREGIATDEQRDVIVAELVRAVFAVPDTGFVNSDGDSVTINTPANSLLGGITGKAN